jgi:hypothetical protein
VPLRTRSNPSSKALARNGLAPERQYPKMYLHRRFAAVIAALLVFVFAGSTLASAATSVHKRGTTHTKKQHKKHRKHHKKHRKHHKKKHRKHRKHKKRKHAPVAPVPAPAPPPPPPAPAFTLGMVSGPAAAWEAGLTDTANLHPKEVRVPLQIGASVTTVQKQIDGLAAKGEQALLLAEFPGRIPSTSEAQSLAGWAKVFGPGGSYWQGRDGSLAVRHIEFGNETNLSYQFGGVSSGPSYIARAQAYAQRARDAADAIRAANPGVGLIIQGDNGGSGTSQWVDGMFSAVPDLTSHIAGWTMHPYGPKSRWQPIMDKVVSDTAKHGDTTLPFFITEYGISTNNGVCLDSNYTWPTCLTYQQAGDAMRGAIADMRARYGSRLAEMFIFEQRDMATDPNGREANFGAVKPDGSPKGAYTTTIRDLLNTYRG